MPKTGVRGRARDHVDMTTGAAIRFARHGLGLYFSFQILDEKKIAEALVSTRQTTIPHETHDCKGRE